MVFSFGVVTVVTFLITVGMTFVLVLLALALFWKLGAPVYRVEKINIIRLLEMVVSDQASESDWHVFSAYTIRHDPALADIQQRCLAIADREWLGREGALVSPRGKLELSQILEELKGDSGKG
jgi:hypothetical protein